MQKVLSRLQLQQLQNIIGMSEFSEEFTDHEGERGHDMNYQMVTAQRTHRTSICSTGVPEFSGEVVALGDRYSYIDSMEHLIGLGGYGVVFKGFDPKTSRDVAVKRMSRIHIKENELRVIKSLRSPYLVGVLDICLVDELTCCLVMELMDADLEYHIKQKAVNGRLRPKNLRLIIDNIARGYKALFDQRIVHRDIKPQNILVKYDNYNPDQLISAKITDFGIARTLDEDGESDLCNVAGTLFYMAPEVGANLLKCCQYDSKVDMWSIGCLLYQCVTGETPFDECLLCKLFLYTAGANFEAYDQPELPEQLPEEVSSIIQSLLEIDSTRRCTPNQFYETVTHWNPIAC